MLQAQEHLTAQKQESAFAYMKFQDRKCIVCLLKLFVLRYFVYTGSKNHISVNVQIRQKRDKLHDFIKIIANIFKAW